MKIPVLASSDITARGLAARYQPKWKDQVLTNLDVPES